MAVKIGPFKQETKENNSSRDEVCEKNNRIGMDRL